METKFTEGIYYESKQISAGSMGTSRVHNSSHELHYYCKYSDDEMVTLYYLKATGEPTSMEAEKISLTEFNKRFKPTPPDRFKPKPEEDFHKLKAEKKVSIANEHYLREEYNAAAYEYSEAIKIDDKNLAAHLGAGKSYIKLGDEGKAKKNFNDMAKLDSLYEKENKHIFNEYGIELRKNKLYDLAIKNYTKAISIDPKDEALYFNAGRAYFESANRELAEKYILKALSINPKFKEAESLLETLRTNNKKK